MMAVQSTENIFSKPKLLIESIAIDFQFWGTEKALNTEWLNLISAKNIEATHLLIQKISYFIELQLFQFNYTNFSTDAKWNQSSV